MNKYPDFWSVLLGNGPRGFFFGYITLAVISAFAMIFVMASQKYKSVPNSPDQWSWKYFLANNSGNFVASFFVLPILIRLIYEYVDAAWMILVSVGLGFGFYRLAKIANDLGIWTTDKISDKIAEKIKSTEIKP